MHSETASKSFYEDIEMLKGLLYTVEIGKIQLYTANL